jgi:excisionase family DNA binding protein
MNETSELLTITEFAAPLRVKPSCVRRWIREGKITVVKCGRLTRIPRTEIERLVRLGTRPAKTGGRDA